MTYLVRYKSWMLFAYCQYNHWCHTNMADHIHKRQQQYYQNSFTSITLKSYTVKSTKPTNIKCWLTSISDGAQTAVTQWAFSPEPEPVAVSQRLGSLCYSTPNCWVPSCAEESVSTRVAKSSWHPEWPFLISVRWWRHSAGMVVDLENL